MNQMQGTQSVVHVDELALQTFQAGSVFIYKTSSFGCLLVVHLMLVSLLNKSSQSHLLAHPIHPYLQSHLAPPTITTPSGPRSAHTSLVLN